MQERTEDRGYEPSDKTRDWITSTFIYHPPVGNQAVRYSRIRGEGGKLADFFARNCPESRELSLALTNIQQAVMWANAAIAINEPTSED